MNDFEDAVEHVLREKVESLLLTETDDSDQWKVLCEAIGDQDSRRAALTRNLLRQLLRESDTDVILNLVKGLYHSLYCLAEEVFEDRVREEVLKAQERQAEDRAQAAWEAGDWRPAL